jgi:GntR family transcriptional regulator, transcriptional repressor for pyruvate dehydrogenase complex
LADTLRARIVDGELRPGERLPTEPQLCASSGLSRSTVREALRLLASQHLITTTRGVAGGSFVSRPSTTDLADTLSAGLRLLIACGPLDGRHVFEVRELIEMRAAALAARRAGPDDVRALRAAYFDPVLDGVDAMHAAQRAFHHALLAATGNPIMEMVARPLYAVDDERAIAWHAPPGYWSRVDGEHRAITEAVAAGDEAAAYAAAADHLEHVRHAHATAGDIASTAAGAATVSQAGAW